MASSILVIALTVALAGFVYVVRSTRLSTVQAELDIEVQTAMESLKQHLRLSSIDEITYYPAGNGPYTALSFPMARDDDDDGAVEVDANGSIIWDRQVIYHVWSGVPNELRMTVFDPRSDLSPTERQEQLDHVVANGNGAGTHNGANADTRVVFANLFKWSVSSPGDAGTFDGYDGGDPFPFYHRLGSFPLTGGSHSFTFTVVGRNPSSTGFRVGVDYLFMSPSSYVSGTPPLHGRREGEWQLPVAAESGASAARTYMQGSWSGNYHLRFFAVTNNNFFTLTLENDRWEETNFNEGGTHSNTTVVFDQTLTPNDFVVQIEGRGTNWTASAQTGGSNGVPCVPDVYRGCAVRVIVRGGEMPDGGWLQYDGRYCTVGFRSCGAVSDSLKIEDAFIAECASSDTNSPDAKAGTFTRLLFSGAGAAAIPAGTFKWTDPAAFAIDETKSYLVTYRVRDDGTSGNAREWLEVTAPSAVGAYVIPRSAAPDAAVCQSATWSTNAAVLATNRVPGVEMLATTYPADAFYLSGVFNTALDAPVYSDMSWNAVKPSGTDVRMYVRTGNSEDMSGAGAWFGPMTAPGAISPGARPYVQFGALLLSDAYGLETPKLKDVTVRWAGETRVMDIGGVFTKGPNYGKFKLTIDGMELTRALTVYLEIFDQALGYRGDQTLTSSLVAEVTPRNSGK